MIIVRTSNRCITILSDFRFNFDIRNTVLEQLWIVFHDHFLLEQKMFIVFKLFFRHTSQRENFLNMF